MMLMTVSSCSSKPLELVKDGIDSRLEKKGNSSLNDIITTLQLYSPGYKTSIRHSVYDIPTTSVRILNLYIYCFYVCSVQLWASQTSSMASSSAFSSFFSTNSRTSLMNSSGF